MQGIKFDKVSITAKLVAFARQFSDIAFAEDVAAYISAEDSVREISSKLKGSGSSSPEDMIAVTKTTAPLIEARYKSIAELIRRTKVEQVLELASGFSMRGLAMAQDSGLIYVDTDLPEITGEKRLLVSLLKDKHALDAVANYHVESANALVFDEIESVSRIFNASKPIAVVSEGLIPYLVREEQDVLATNVNRLLSQFAGGYWITPDFTTKQIADGDMDSERKRFREAVNSSTDRPLHKGAFESEEAIEDFINSHGFSFEHWFQTKLIPPLVSPGRLGIGAEVVDRLQPRMQVWLMTLA